MAGPMNSAAKTGTQSTSSVSSVITRSRPTTIHDAILIRLLLTPTQIKVIVTFLGAV
jgi:hypothetical protein